MPRLATSCLPTLAVPVIDGVVVAAAFISTLVVVADHQVRGEVPSLSARTATEMNLFAYSGITLRVFPMAPEIAVQSLGSALRGSYEYELHAYHNCNTKNHFLVSFYYPFVSRLGRLCPRDKYGGLCPIMQHHNWQGFRAWRVGHW